MKKNTYEVVVVLNTQGKEDTVEKMISQVGREIESEGAKLEQIDQIGRRKFAYTPRRIDEGFYVNFQFQSEPANLDKVRNRLKLNPDICMQHCQRLSA
ncbi:MAG: 30S ribosomal protein S6 [Verrucomicrobiales bacterium]